MVGAPRSPQPFHRTTSSTGSIKVEPFRSSISPYLNRSSATKDTGLYHHVVGGSPPYPQYHSRGGSSRIRSFLSRFVPPPFRRLIYLHPTAYLVPLFLFFFLIASSSLSQSPDNHPLEILQQLPLHPLAPFHVKCHDSPKHSLEIKNEYIDRVPPGQDHKVTVICLHGFNDKNKWTDPLKDAFPYVKWVHPKGRTINITAQEGYASAAWYDIKSFKDLHEEEDRPAMLETQREINEVIKKERQVFTDRGDVPRIAIAGFGQGATMALLNALTAEEPIEGAIVLSGYLPVPSKAIEIGAVAHKTIPIFWGHGKKDPYFSVSVAEGDAAALRLPPYSLKSVEFHAYDSLEHFWSEKEVDDLILWFGYNVPPSLDMTSFNKNDRLKVEPGNSGAQKNAEDDGEVDRRIVGKKGSKASPIAEDEIDPEDSESSRKLPGKPVLGSITSIPESLDLVSLEAAKQDVNQDGHPEDDLADRVKEAAEKEAPDEAALLDPSVLEDEVQDLPAEETLPKITA